MRNQISVKIDFCNTLLAECLVFQSQTAKFGLKNHQKKKPESKHDKIHFFVQGTQKALKMRSLNPPEIDKIKPGQQTVFSCAPECFKIAPGSPRTRKWRHHACQMTSLGTKNPRSLCKNVKNSQAYSNEQWSRAGGRGRSP